MKLSKIKTREEFYTFSDVWYQRTHNLRMIYQDERQPKKKREKAKRLYKIMLIRVMKCFQIAIQISAPKPKDNK